MLHFSIVFNQIKIRISNIYLLIMGFQFLPNTRNDSKIKNIFGHFQQARQAKSRKIQNQKTIKSQISTAFQLILQDFAPVNSMYESPHSLSDIQTSPIFGSLLLVCFSSAQVLQRFFTSHLEFFHLKTVKTA